VEKFAVIIPCRGDRPDFIAHCMNQLARMTRKPDCIFHINWKPIGRGFDLVERVHDGVCKAKAAGYDVVFIVENDDFYEADYFEKFGDFNADFFGSEKTTYYHLKNREHQTIQHPFRASLFTTGFRISTLDKFKWGGDQFLDLKLWEYAKKQGLRKLFVNVDAIGIKHGLGKCGGKGHKMKMKYSDHEMQWLKSKVDPYSYLFYTAMSRKLWEKELA